MGCLLYRWRPSAFEDHVAHLEISISTSLSPASQSSQGLFSFSRSPSLRVCLIFRCFALVSSLEIPTTCFAIILAISESSSSITSKSQCQQHQSHIRKDARLDITSLGVRRLCLRRSHIPRAQRERSYTWRLGFGGGLLQLVGHQST